ncbi:unnamed protein product [Linum tenue]|uniref:Uncharacterized protein n=1 Tax=Linum tenue TaxID=586396 RepID=A0AAV0LM48_9ROSI|nr:unnamed protein product [Linum tenue]
MAIVDIAPSPDVVEDRRLTIEVFRETPVSGGDEEDTAKQVDGDQVYKVVPDDKLTWEHLRFDNTEAFVKFNKDFVHRRGFAIRRIGEQTFKSKYLQEPKVLYFRARCNKEGFKTGSTIDIIVLASDIPSSTIDIIPAGLHFLLIDLDLL